MKLLKPQFFYHASPNSGIEEFEPRRLSSPGIEFGHSPERVFASDDPAYAAGHGFRWGNSSGIELGFEDDGDGEKRVCLSVAWDQKDLLDQPVYIYQLPADGFEELIHVTPKGHNFATEKNVKPVSVQSFPDVRSAVEFYGGRVKIKGP